MVKNLKSLRWRYRISQQKLAEVLGVSQQSINKYENHGTEPDILLLCRMADYFDTTVDYLVGRGDRQTHGGEACPQRGLSLEGLSDSQLDIVLRLLREFQKTESK